jgi:NAD(P)-dependent dehydrogenase (short-subunit alcohol dehydrogenase family)
MNDETRNDDSSIKGLATLVTGGTDGVGKEIARELAGRGRGVIIVGRNQEKGQRAEDELRKATGNPEIVFLKADLSLMQDVRQLAREVSNRWPVLHGLVHVAGIVRGRRIVTSEGVESNFAINYLSRFLLTELLLPMLTVGGQGSRAARIVIVSGAAQDGRIHFDDVNLTSNFSTLRVVLQQCRANDLFTQEQSRRLDPEKLHSRITINCIKLGVVKTNIRAEFPWWMRLLVPLVLDPLIGQTPNEAAQPALKLLLAEEFESVTGALFTKIRTFKRLAVDIGPDDLEQSRRLWSLSERMSRDALSGRPVATHQTPMLAPS